MFYEFGHRHVPCTVDGEPDVVMLSRESKATSIIGKESMYNGIFAPDSPVAAGSIVITDDTFLVLTKRKTTDADAYCSLIKTNAAANLQRYGEVFGEHRNVTDRTFSTIESDIPAFAQHVNAQMRQDDIGLLPKTTVLLIVPVSFHVKGPQEPGLIAPDRVQVFDRNYQVDDVDRMKYPNLLQLQLSEDVR